MNSTSPLHMSNGHDESFARSSPSNDDAQGESESELSDVRNPIVDEPSPASSSHQPRFGAQDSDASEDSSPEDQEQSDDADFDEEDAPAVAAFNGQRSERSSTVESSRPPKRKSGGNDHDHYFLENPELYGLRRSVGAPHSQLVVELVLTCFHIYRRVQSKLEPLYVAPDSPQFTFNIYRIGRHKC